MQFKDYLILSSVILIWGVNFLAMKWGLNEVPPLILGMLRFLFVLMPALLFLKRPNTKWRYLIGYGLTISFGQFSLMFLALSWNFPTGLSALILQAQVFLTVLFAFFILKEAVKTNHVIGMSIAGMGLGLIGVGQYQGGLSLIGILPVLGASISWAFGNIIVKKIGPVGALSLVVWGNISAFIAFSTSSFFYYGLNGIIMHLNNLTHVGILSAMFLAYFANFIGYTGWGYLLARHSASKVTPFIMLVPILALIIGAIVLKEHLGFWHYLGIGVVLFGLSVHLLGGHYFGKNNYHKTS